MSPSPVPLGLGVDAGLDASVAAALAARCSELGYGSMWSNDEPSAPGLETLAHFARGAPDLDIGVGVLPIDQHPPPHIAAEIERLALDPAKLWLGIGSGRLRPQRAPLRDAVSELRDLLPGARIMIGAMGPRLCSLGGEVADGVLLNWMVPDHAARMCRCIDDAAHEAGRSTPIAALYVRAAVGDGAVQRLVDEERRYRGFAAAHFAEMGAPLGTVGVAGAGKDVVSAGLAPYRSAVDITVVRVLAQRDLASLVEVAEAAAP